MHDSRAQKSERPSQVSDLDCITRKAGEIFARKGFAQVSMRQLATALEIAPGSIYYHVESKQALLGELIEDLYQTLLAGLARKSCANLPPRDRLHRLFDQHLLLHTSKSNQFLLAERESHCLEGIYKASVDSLRARYERTLGMLIAQSTGRPCSTRLVEIAQTLVSFLNNLPMWLKTGDLDILGQRVLALNLMQGFLTRLCDAPGTSCMPVSAA